MVSETLGGMVRSPEWGIYIPVELFEVAHGLSWAKLTVLSVNLAIVAYLIYALMESGRGKAGGDRKESPS
jgi:uncharacterized membrane protein (DUF2068 family)